MPLGMNYRLGQSCKVLFERGAIQTIKGVVGKDEPSRDTKLENKIVNCHL